MEHGYNIVVYVHNVRTKYLICKCFNLCLLKEPNGKIVRAKGTYNVSVCNDHANHKKTHVFTKCDTLLLDWLIKLLSK